MPRSMQSTGHRRFFTRDAQNRLHLLEEIQAPTNWSRSRDGGPRKITRQDLRLAAEETE